MNCQKCDQPTAGKSKYCVIHRAEARANFIVMCADSKLAREERDQKFETLMNQLAGIADTAYMAAQPAPMAVYETPGMSQKACVASHGLWSNQLHRHSLNGLPAKRSATRPMTGAGCFRCIISSPA